MIKPGEQILRFVKISTARQNVSWLYKFTADSLSGDHLDFVFMVSDAGSLPSIIKDLVLMVRDKKWWKVHLVENPQRLLMIKSIKEPTETQEELDLKSKSERLKIQ